MNKNYKTILFIVFLIIVTIGFIIKIPVPLRKLGDKNLHICFYFFASIFLYVLNKNNIINIIFLILFGIFIEYLQEFSNRFFHNHIHAKHDFEDVYANIKGIFYYLICYYVIYFISSLSKSISSKSKR